MTTRELQVVARELLCLFCAPRSASLRPAPHSLASRLAQVLRQYWYRRAALGSCSSGAAHSSGDANALKEFNLGLDVDHVRSWRQGEAVAEGNVSGEAKFTAANSTGGAVGQERGDNALADGHVESTSEDWRTPEQPGPAVAPSLEAFQAAPSALSSQSASSQSASPTTPVARLQSPFSEWPRRRDLSRDLSRTGSTVDLVGLDSSGLKSSASSSTCASILAERSSGIEASGALSANRGPNPSATARLGARSDPRFQTAAVKYLGWDGLRQPVCT